jgi:hypothetical protein
VVIGLGFGGDRGESGRSGFVVAQPGAGGGLVEDLDDLGAQAAGEPPVPAQGVLPRAIRPWSVRDPVPGGDPASYDAAIVDLSHRVRRLAPRLTATS